VSPAVAFSAVAAGASQKQLQSPHVLEVSLG
jgi:hypothetical protein